jgi:hypothetical protein
MILITVYLGPLLGRALHTIATKVDGMTAGRAQGHRATTVILHNKIHLNDGLHGSKLPLLLQLPSSLYLNRSIYSWTTMSNLIFTLCFSFVFMLIYCGLQQFVCDTYFYVILINHIFKYLFFLLLLLLFIYRFHPYMLQTVKDPVLNWLASMSTLLHEFSISPTPPSPSLILHPYRFDCIVGSSCHLSPTS